MPTVAFSKFNDFVEQLGLAVHNLNTHTINAYLSNTTPDAAADTVKTDLAEIATGNGYTGGVDTQNTWAESSGTATLTGTAITITASGAVGPFRYVVLENSSASNRLVGYWDYGSSISLAAGETFTIKFNNSATTGSILTLS